jgi:nitrogen fixation/metabolism regulation signal transduction histidine kinase
VQNGLDAVADRDDGRVELVTETARDERGAVRAVRLVVRDNGPGFADQVLKRAFEPYVTTKAKGTGLGLAVVRKIADEHGARVRIGNRAAPEGHPPKDPAGGAEVSISFSGFIPAPPAPAAGSGQHPPSAGAAPDPSQVH